jgi:wyosine [tRNA(Phe)-imidazoG37] synthetase (radical SAM superfamily)
MKPDVEERIMPAVMCANEFAQKIKPPCAETAFGCPRDFLGNRFVYVVISARARALSVGINMNPDKFCNFDCVYCEVNRGVPAAEQELDVHVMGVELQHTLLLVASGKIRERPPYRDLGPELVQLRHVAFSGDGEPTSCPSFVEAVETVVHVRARQFYPFFEIVLITNGSGLDARNVQEGLQYFTVEDEIWIKLDAGTQGYMDRVNRSEVSLEKIMANTLLIGRQRPVVIQSLFPAIHDREPAAEEIDQYIARLKDLKREGARISLVQIYSATRPIAHPECTHLRLKSLSPICQRVTTETGLKAEVF